MIIPSSENPIFPRTTPEQTQTLSSILLKLSDGTEFEVIVENEAGFYRESVMKVNGNKLNIQEVFITNGTIKRDP